MSMNINKSSWADYKELLDKKNPNWQHDERADGYFLFFEEGTVTYACDAVKKTDPRSADQIDWEDNYKSRSNYAAASRPYAFSTPDFLFAGDGVTATCAAGQVTEIDYRFTQTTYVNGGELMAQNPAFGDWVEIVVVDKDNLLGYGANFVLSQYVKKWYVDPSRSMSIQTPYAGKIPAGMWMRVKYHSVGASDVPVAINYLMHLPL